MSTAEVVYQSNLREVQEAAMSVLEVDGIPVNYTENDFTRIGLFSVKEDEGNGGEAYISSEESMAQEVWFFCNTSPMGQDAFYDYDEARFWSHP